MTEVKAREMSLKIGKALEYLHDNSIILRNLQSSGILMSDVDKNILNEDPIPRIFKLDKAKVIGYDDYTDGIYGDIRYRAPEVLKGKAYDLRADTWSFGIILFYILTGKCPFEFQDLFFSK